MKFAPHVQFEVGVIETEHFFEDLVVGLVYFRISVGSALIAVNIHRHVERLFVKPVDPFDELAAGVLGGAA
jgi:hypothetical protein